MFEIVARWAIAVFAWSHLANLVRAFDERGIEVDVPRLEEYVRWLPVHQMEEWADVTDALLRLDNGGWVQPGERQWWEALAELLYLPNYHGGIRLFQESVRVLGEFDPPWFHNVDWQGEFRELYASAWRIPTELPAVGLEEQMLLLLLLRPKFFQPCLQAGTHKQRTRLLSMTGDRQVAALFIMFWELNDSRNYPLLHAYLDSDRFRWDE